MRRRGRPAVSALALLVAAIALARPMAAQPATATLLLEVLDASGAPLSGVRIAVVNQSTLVERSAVTSPRGTAVVPLLPAGDYVLTATLTGFRQAVVERFHLDAGVKQALTLTLEPGAISETVRVSAEGARSRTGNSAVGEVFDGQVLMMTPVASRDVGEFAWQAPGATPPAPGSRLSGEGGTPVNVSGAREASNNFLLDGVDNNDLFLNRVLVTPSLDAVQEFTLLTSTYDAEFGRNAGAQVNVVLKSGGQRASGSLYEYFRHRSLESRGIFDPADEPEPYRRRHQFGGTIGGPVGPLPAFYFASLEATADRTADTRVTRVPTAAERAGSFAALGRPILDPFTGAPFPGNRIPAERLDETGARIAALYPAPNRDDPAANFVSSPIGGRDTLQAVTKVDWQQAADAPAFVRYAFSRDDHDDPFPEQGRNVPGFGTSTLDAAHNVAAGFATIFSDRLFNDLRIGWNRLRRETIAAGSGVDGYGALDMRGPPLPSIDLGYPAIVVAGLDALGDDIALPVVRGTHTIHVSNTLSLERGRHLAKIGGEVRHYRSDGFNHLFSRGQLNFFGAYTGSGFADLLLGLPTVTLLGTNDNPQALRTTAVNLFVQDDWRVSSALTLNAGVRYELNQPPIDADDRMAIFDPATATVRRVGRDGVPRSGIRRDANNLAPRAGFSWSPRADGDLVVRGGYGVYYDSGTLIETSALYFNPPFFVLDIYAPVAEPITAANPFPSGAGFTPPPGVNTLDPDVRTGHSHHGSLGIETRVRDLEVAVRWVGSRGVALVRKRNLNQPAPAPGPVDARRPIPGFGDILFVESEASSVYHALQLRLERPAPQGLWLRGSWTWGRSIDDASGFLASDGNDNTPQNSRDPAAERGLSDFDVRHRVVLAALWTLPDAGPGWLRGWQVSALFSAQSGRPFTPRVSFDNSNTGNLGGQFGYDRPNEVDPSTPGASVYDGRGFLVAPPFTFGDAGRNILIGPGFASVDLSVVKILPLGGSRRLELRGEVYNLLNRENLGLPDSFIDRATFGQSLSAGPGRRAQLALRFTF